MPKTYCPRCGSHEFRKVDGQEKFEPHEAFLMAIDVFFLFRKGKEKTKYVCCLCETEFEARRPISMISFLFYWGIIIFLVTIIVMNSGWF